MSPGALGHLIDSTQGIKGHRVPHMGENGARDHLGSSLDLGHLVRMTLMVLACPRHWK